MKNLRVIMDGDLSFSNHITNITKVAFFQLRTWISKIRGFPSLTQKNSCMHFS